MANLTDSQQRRLRGDFLILGITGRLVLFSLIFRQSYLKSALACRIIHLVLAILLETYTRRTPSTFRELLNQLPGRCVLG